MFACICLFICLFVYFSFWQFWSSWHDRQPDLCAPPLEKIFPNPLFESTFCMCLCVFVCVCLCVCVSLFLRLCTSRWVSLFCSCILFVPIGLHPFFPFNPLSVHLDPTAQPLPNGLWILTWDWDRSHICTKLKSLRVDFRFLALCERFIFSCA